MPASAIAAQAADSLNHDPITGTSLHTLENHPILSARAMKRIDRAIDAWWKRSAANSPVEVSMPSRWWRECRKNETFNEACERPATSQEACAIRVEVLKSFTVDARRSDWQAMAAEQLEAMAEILKAEAALLRQVDGSELTEGGAA